MDLSGLNNLVDIFGSESKKVMNGMDELNKIQGHIKAQIPEQYLDDCNEIFELSKRTKSALSKDEDISNITDELKVKMNSFKNKHGL